MKFYLTLSSLLLTFTLQTGVAGQFTDCMTKHKASGRSYQGAATACVAIASHPKLTMEEFQGCVSKISAHVTPSVAPTACSILTVRKNITLPQFTTCMSDFIQVRSDLDLSSSDIMAANACTLILFKKTTAKEFSACIDRYFKAVETSTDEGSHACTVIVVKKISPKEFLACIDQTHLKLNYSDSISAEACKSLSGDSPSNLMCGRFAHYKHRSS